MAFRTKRRRRPNVAWLPGWGLGAGANVADANRPGGITGSLANNDTVATYNEIAWDAFPLTMDFSKEASDVSNTASDPEQNPSLSDLVGGSEWRLRRIVGKFWASAACDELDAPVVQGIAQHVGLGFIVSRCYDDGSPLTDFNEVNPLALNSKEDPWIWQRTWMLSPNGTAAWNTTDDLRQNAAWWSYPRNTAQFGSAVDGPHIDQKTARRLHRGERLFAVVAIRQWRLDPLNAGPNSEVIYHLDYRLLGSIIRSGTGNRRNASR